jgi:hypothetical protein
LPYRVRSVLLASSKCCMAVRCWGKQAQLCFRTKLCECCHLLRLFCKLLVVPAMPSALGSRRSCAFVPNSASALTSFPCPASCWLCLTRQVPTGADVVSHHPQRCAGPRAYCMHHDTPMRVMRDMRPVSSHASLHGIGVAWDFMFAEGWCARSSLLACFC